MRIIAVAVDDARGLESTVAGHCGRCPYYLVAVTEGLEVRATRLVPNPFASCDLPGDMLSFLDGLGANVVLTGTVPLRSTNCLDRFGIEEVPGARGHVGDALTAYLEAAVEPPRSGVVRRSRARRPRPRR